MGKERLSKARTVLMETARTNKALGPIARRCLSAVEAAHKDAERSFAEIQESRE